MKIEEKIINTLTKVRHDCERRGLDFGHLDSLAYQHYIEENGQNVEKPAGDPRAQAKVLLRQALDQWGERVDADEEEINGADAVDWLCGFIQDAQDILKIGGFNGLLKRPKQHKRVLHGKCPVCGHYGDNCTGSLKAWKE